MQLLSQSPSFIYFEINPDGNIERSFCEDENYVADILDSPLIYCQETDWKSECSLLSLLETCGQYAFIAILFFAYCSDTKSKKTKSSNQLCTLLPIYSPFEMPL